MSKKKKIFLSVICIALLLAIGTGVVVALVMKQATDTSDQTLTPGRIAVTVNGDYTVTNNGNTSAYIRAKIVANWMKNGKIYGESKPATVTTGANWTLKADGYYYYTPTVAAGGVTTALITNPSQFSAETPPAAGCSVDINVYAEGIQATGTYNGQNAYEEAWNSGAAENNPNANLTQYTGNTIKYQNVFDHIGGVSLAGQAAGANNETMPYYPFDAAERGMTVNEALVMEVHGWLGVEGGIDRYVYTVDTQNWITAEGGRDGEPLPGYYANDLGINNATSMGLFTAPTPLKIDLSAYAGETINVAIGAVPKSNSNQVIAFTTIKNLYVPAPDMSEVLNLDLSMDDLSWQMKPILNNDSAFTNGSNQRFVFKETAMFLEKNEGMPLLFPIEKIESVTNYFGDVTYEAGTDYYVQDGKLYLTENTRIPCFGYNNFYYGLNNGNAHDAQYVDLRTLPTTKNGLPDSYAGIGVRTAAQENLFQTYQISVSYYHTSTWPGYEQECRLDMFQDVIRKMQKGEDVTIMFYGDSITAGACSTFSWKGWGQGGYALLVTQSLAELFDYDINYVNTSGLVYTFANGAQGTPATVPANRTEGTRGTITYVNTAIGGWTSLEGLQSFDTFLKPYINTYGCDMFVCALGMNDSTATLANYTPAMTADNAKAIVDKVYALSPKANVLLVGTMWANPDANGWNSQQYKQTPYLETLASNYRKQGRNCAMANVTETTAWLLQRKDFIDYSGNNINHPNDFGYRIYAQVILQTILGYENIKS